MHGVSDTGSKIGFIHTLSKLSIEAVVVDIDETVCVSVGIEL